MPIQFRCLNCGEMISAEDKLAGSTGECDDCGATYTVPVPIGGRLTDKRLATPIAPFPAQAETVPELSQHHLTKVSAPVSEDEIEFWFRPENVPTNGFVLQIYIEDAVYGRNERLWVENSVEYIREVLLHHLESHPQYYSRGYLLLVVNRWSVKPDSYDVNLRLVGLIDDKEFSEYFYATPDSSETPSLLKLSGLVIAILKAVRSVLISSLQFLQSLLFGFSSERAFHYRLRKQAARELQVRLDDSVNRPQPLFTRLWRRLNAEL